MENGTCQLCQDGDNSRLSQLMRRQAAASRFVYRTGGHQFPQFTNPVVNASATPYNAHDSYFTAHSLAVSFLPPPPSSPPLLLPGCLLVFRRETQEISQTLTRPLCDLMYCRPIFVPCDALVRPVACCIANDVIARHQR